MQWQQNHFNTISCVFALTTISLHRHPQLYTVESAAAAAAPDSGHGERRCLIPVRAAAAVVDDMDDWDDLDPDEPDPLDEVVCSECLDGGDEALLLLCENFDHQGHPCGGAAHQHCVGLGSEPLPEDTPWLCMRCARDAAPEPARGGRVRRGGGVSRTRPWRDRTSSA